MKRRGFLMAGGALGITCFSGQSIAQPATGFYVPAEEARHDRTFMQWPVSRTVHPDPVFLKMVQRTIAEIANTISAFEPVIMLAGSEYHADISKQLSAAIEIWDVPTEDLWCRDAGPVFAINNRGELAVKQIQFNGWGRKQVHAHDARIADRVAERLGLPLQPTGLIGEAGGVEQDGHGALMAHESSWVNDNRNPGLARDEIEARLLAAYGAKRMIWSEGVWGEDITDYHIDSLARFTGPGRGIINLPDRPDNHDPFHMAALDTHDRLVAAGMDMDVIPEPHYRRVKNLDFVAAYANYYVCNGGVIAARFGDAETDQIASETLASHYPGREVVTLNVDVLGELGGGIHCATQQMPTS
ncbi:agmatine deiminase family protein [Ruegeria sp. AD91A]|uniref:agmatine deiminase family protein n=1 Tax=Ruegeria sp. AD91A TaxID=2293862 RepID=UPI000E46884D|nr:agmatine deiminase family protein [Ruegeria sp. AD91A]AXT25756.1 agmatine deiminase family protein [Ruegeria sp. AD91A]